MAYRSNLPTLRELAMRPVVFAKMPSAAPTSYTYRMQSHSNPWLARYREELLKQNKAGGGGGGGGGNRQRVLQLLTQLERARLSANTFKEELRKARGAAQVDRERIEQLDQDIDELTELLEEERQALASEIEERGRDKVQLTDNVRTAEAEAEQAQQEADQYQEAAVRMEQQIRQLEDKIEGYESLLQRTTAPDEREDVLLKRLDLVYADLKKAEQERDGARASVARLAAQRQEALTQQRAREDERDQARARAVELERGGAAERRPVPGANQDFNDVLVQLEQRTTALRQAELELVQLRAEQDLRRNETAGGGGYDNPDQAWILNTNAVYAALDANLAIEVEETNLVLEDPEDMGDDPYFEAIDEFIDNLAKFSAADRQRLPYEEAWRQLKESLGVRRNEPAALPAKLDRLKLAVAMLKDDDAIKFKKIYEELAANPPVFDSVGQGDGVDQLSDADIANVRQYRVLLERWNDQFLEAIMKKNLRVPRIKLARLGPMQKRNVIRDGYIGEKETRDAAVAKDVADLTEQRRKEANEEVFDQYSSVWRLLYDWGDKKFPDKSVDPWTEYRLRVWQGRQGVTALPSSAAYSLGLLIEPEGVNRFFKRASDELNTHRLSFYYTPPDRGRPSPFPPLDQVLTPEELKGLLHMLEKDDPVWLRYENDFALSEGRAGWDINQTPKYLPNLIDQVKKRLQVEPALQERIRKGLTPGVAFQLPSEPTWVRRRVNVVDRRQAELNISLLTGQTIELRENIREEQERENERRGIWLVDRGNKTKRKQLVDSMLRIAQLEKQLEKKADYLDKEQQRLARIGTIERNLFDENAEPPRPSAPGLQNRDGLGTVQAGYYRKSLASADMTWLAGVQRAIGQGASAAYMFERF